MNSHCVFCFRVSQSAYLRLMWIMRWLSILAAISIIIACFFPWVRVPGKDVFFGGFYSSNENYGKPGLLHVVFSGLVILFLLINKVWSFRLAFFISAINIAWALRNYMIMSTCRGGECPEKLTALYVVAAASLCTTIFLLFSKRD